MRFTCLQRSLAASCLYLALLCLAGTAAASETLTGNWDGAREQLIASGVELGLEYTADYFKVTSGGVNRKGEYLDNVDLTAALDAEKLLGLKGGAFFLYILGNNGGSPSEHAGDYQTLSNIDSPDAWEVYEVWYDQRFATD